MGPRRRSALSTLDVRFGRAPAWSRGACCAPCGDRAETLDVHPLALALARLDASGAASEEDGSGCCVEAHELARASRGGSRRARRGRRARETVALPYPERDTTVPYEVDYLRLTGELLMLTSRLEVAWGQVQRDAAAAAWALVRLRAVYAGVDESPDREVQDEVEAIAQQLPTTIGAVRQINALRASAFGARRDANRRLALVDRTLDRLATDVLGDALAARLSYLLSLAEPDVALVEASAREVADLLVLVLEALSTAEASAGDVAQYAEDLANAATAAGGESRDRFDQALLTARGCVAEIERIRSLLVAATEQVSAGGGDATEVSASADLADIAAGRANEASGQILERVDPLDQALSRLAEALDAYAAAAAIEDAVRAARQASDLSASALAVAQEAEALSARCCAPLAALGAALSAARATACGTPAAASESTFVLGSTDLVVDPPAPVGPLTSIGINAVKVEEYDETASDGQPADVRYGKTDAILADLDASSTLGPAEGLVETWAGLGLHFFRQPTGANTLWGDLEVPVATDSDGAVEEADVSIEALGDRPRNAVYAALYDARWAGLRQMFSRLGPGTGPHPQKVVLTVLTNGAVGLGEGEVAGCTCDPLGQFDSDLMVRLSFAAGHDDDGGLNEPVILAPGDVLVALRDVFYATEHDSTADVAIDTFVPACSDLCRTQGASNEWLTRILDSRSRYKLGYVYLIGQAVGQLLVDLQASFDAESDEATATTEGTCGEGGSTDPWALYCRDRRPDVFGSLLAIEICNEINKDNLLADGSVSTAAKWWARVVRECARGLHDALAAERAADRVSFWLPALAMYTRRTDDPSTSEKPTFDVVSAWNEQFLQWLPEVAAEVGSTPDEHAWLARFTNQDYHHYAYSVATGAGPIARLAYEVGELQDQLDVFNVTASGLTGTTVAVALTVCETGASSNEDDVPRFSSTTGEPAEGAWEDPFPYVTELSEAEFDATFRARFQAREVWRRLAVAAAAGAPFVAWHTFLANLEDNFSGTSLREETEGSLDDPATAEDATRKAAWWAVQRFTRLLSTPNDPDTGELGGLHARFLHLPAQPVDADGQPISGDHLDPTSASDMLVIVEFSPTPVASHAYLVLIDPSAATTLGSVSVCVNNESEGRVVQIPIVPDPATHPVTTTAAPAEGYFAEESIAAAWDDGVAEWTAPWFLVPDLAVDEDPVLLLSSAPLTFTLLASTT